MLYLDNFQIELVHAAVKKKKILKIRLPLEETHEQRSDGS